MYSYCNAHLKENTAKALISLGFPADLRGYEYLRCAVIEAYHSPELTAYVTKSLFPRVARLCGRVPITSVSRGCRHAIEHAADFGLLNDFLERTESDAYPPSALVISEIARYLHSSEE